MTALPMSEADLQAAVTDLCDTLGLRWFHSPDSRRENAGFPDIVIAGPGGVIWAELKSARGKVRAAQVAWLTTLRDSGQWAVIWRPVDLRSGRITRALQALARRP